jgi:diguanylate cyclase (GGDEF)-like protein
LSLQLVDKGYIFKKLILIGFSRGLVFSPHPLSDKFSNDLLPLLSAETEDAKLLFRVEELAAIHGDAVYEVMLLMMTGKHFSAELSERYWSGAVRHCEEIFKPEFVGRGFRPALMDFLRHCAGEFSDPRIIEGDYLYNITKSSVTDGLTGLYNQTYFKKILSKTISTQRRNAGSTFALVFLDLDHFKQYNDRCGHLPGDEALRICAEIITKNLRDGDVAVRYGGEEFALLLHGLDRHTAFTVAERIRQGVESHIFVKQELLDSGNLTISGGISLYPDSGESAEEIIQAADAELYRAKGRRNCIYSFSDDRRRNSRCSVRSLVEYASFDGAIYKPALSIDISENGMGLGCESLLEEGSNLSLRLARPYWPENVLLTAKVRQVRRKDEMIIVGLEFDESLDMIDELLTHHKPSLAKG